MLTDSFLFFQELDLLEIRLEYLYSVVDKFIIVEANETFSGLPKEFVFEKNIRRFNKYKDKIIYHKITNFHSNFDSLNKYLISNNNEIYKEILEYLISHNHYKKNNISDVLDSYHRECIHIPLRKFCKDDDLVLISDLDEIPSIEVLDEFKLKKTQPSFKEPFVFEQYEFKYYLNLYSNKKWLGSIVSPYKNIKYKSLNNLRINSQRLSLIKGGYHFTSVGGEKSIINKIESWGHQEFNLNIIKLNIIDNIQNGKDIFYRFGEKDNKILDISKEKIFDDKLKKIFKNYKNLIIDKKEKINNFKRIKFRFIQIYVYLLRLKNNPLKGFIKIIKKIF
tara:strand:- start:567 stop:1571 length:1005 start_codon:yes stop_codon:yes gene_type:complete